MLLGEQQMYLSFGRCVYNPVPLSVQLGADLPS